MSYALFLKPSVVFSNQDVFIQAMMSPELLAEHVNGLASGLVMFSTQRDTRPIGGLLSQAALSSVVGRYLGT